MKKNKNILIISIILFSGILILSGCGNKIKKQMEKAINYINLGQYSEAQKELDVILKEESNNAEANLLNNIINNFKNAKKLYEDKEYDKANEEILKISNEYSNYNIKSDVDDLKNNIKKKLDEMKQIDDNIDELSKLINDEKLDEATKKLDEFIDKDLTELENKKIKDLKEILDRKIKEEKYKKEREEAKRLEAERQKEKNIKENYSNNRKITDNKINKNIKNKDNIHYVNKEFGIQMELPASWREKYYVDQSDNTISFCYKTLKNKNVVGVLLYIQKLEEDTNMNSVIMDDMIIKEINGSRYALGVATDVGTNAFDLGEFDIYKEYKKLKSEKGLVYMTIRSIN